MVGIMFLLAISIVFFGVSLMWICCEIYETFEESRRIDEETLEIIQKTLNNLFKEEDKQ